MENYNDRMKRQIADRDKQKEKVDAITESFERLKSRLAKETAKLEELNDKVERTEYFLLRTRLESVGLSGKDAVDKLLDLYEKHKDEVVEDD